MRLPPAKTAAQMRKIHPEIVAKTLGRDVSGLVVSVGEFTTGFNPGDDVFALLGIHAGGYAEYAVADKRELAPKPKTLTTTMRRRCHLRR